MDSGNRSRGRARARNRPNLPDRSDASAPQPRSVAPGMSPAARSSTGAVPRPGPPIRSPSQSQPINQPGRAARRQSDHRQAVGNVEEVATAVNNISLSGSGRGALRGRRNIASMFETQSLITKPSNLTTKQGTAGTLILLRSNYFELIERPNWCLYQYRVDFAPDQDVTEIKKKLFNMAAQAKDLGGYMFDGSMMFTSHRFKADVWEAFVKAPGSGINVRVTARLVSELNRGDYHMLQLFNIIVRKCLSHMKLQLVGRNYFDALSKIAISEYGMELWPGYVTSIRQHESKILMCVEIAHKFMRRENVLKILHDFSNERNYKKVFTEHIVGCVVLTDYNNRTYRIDDVDWAASPCSTFSKHDGSATTYIDYYKQKYNIRIVEKNQPLLVSRAKAREIRAGMAEMIYLVPELCRMTGLTDAERSNMQMMRALADHTRLAPSGRLDRLRTFSDRMNKSEAIVEELRKWNMSLAKEPVQIRGRVLQPELIVQGRAGDVRYQSGPQADWTKNLRNNSMLSLGRVISWVCVCPAALKRDAYVFVQELIKASNGMSLHLPQPMYQEILDDRAGTYLDGLEIALAHTPSLIMCCATNNKIDRYTAIKKKCCVDRAVPTQVVLKKNIMNKSSMSIATKVAIQINCKLGGAPWTIEMPLSNVMVVGFDVCHDTLNKSQSFGAMVASLDKQCTRYFSATSAHTNGEELSNDFSLNILKAIKRFQEENQGQIPDRIIIYRDGVGDGQLPYVYNHEVKRIEAQLTEYYKGKQLRMAFIVVTKRINTRFFANGQNPPPGTVVDDVVTLPQRYDFFLVSQCVRQGTVSPTSYNVIYDTLALDASRIQRFTYKLTHMYYNWSGTVRVPAPCQYAHKLAFLVSQSLHRTPNPKLDNLLYFL